MSATRQQILNSQFSVWYPLFKDVSLKSEVVPLPPAFVRWLKQDKVSLPPGTTSSLFCSNKAQDGGASSDDEEWSDAVPDKPKEARASLATNAPISKNGLSHAQSQHEMEEKNKAAAATDEASEEFDFTALDTQVRAAVSRLYGGGSANNTSNAGVGKGFFVKLNWSAPQDAAWLNMGSLKCQQPGDAYLLIKASDFCAHDLNFPFDGCREDDNDKASDSSSSGDGSNNVAYTLVLRKWCNLRPERGFRCFVKDRQLVGLSQRDCTVHYPQLEADAPRIRTAIDEFLASRGRSKATKRTSGNSAGLTPGATAETVIPLSSSRCTEHAEDISTSEQPPTLLERLLDANAVLDVYVDAAFKVWLVDVNAWSSTTDSLLFSWDAPPLSIDEVSAEDSAVVPAVAAYSESPGACTESTEVSSADSPTTDKNEITEPAKPLSAAETETPAVTSPPSSAPTAAASATSLASGAPPFETELRLVAASDGSTVRASPMAEYRAPLEMHLFAQALQGGGSAPANGSSPPGDGGLGGMADFQAFMARCERETKEGRHADSSSDGESFC